MAHATLLLLLCLVQSALLASALYTAQDSVVQLTSDNFEMEVIQYKGVAVVEFFAPWCGHCKNLAPTYKQIADRLKGIALVGAVDCDAVTNKNLCASFGIQAFPTVKVFPVGQQKNPYTGQLSKIPEDLQGQASLRAVNDAVSKLYTDTYIKRLNNEQEYSSWSEETAVVPKVVLFTSKSSTTVLYKSLSTQFRNRLVFAEVHESKTGLVEKLGVTDFPTLMVFKGGEKHIYSGKMSAEALQQYLDGFALPAEAVKEEKPSNSKGAGEKDMMATPLVEVHSLSLKNLTDIDALEPAWLVAFAVGTEEDCASQLRDFNKTVQDMQAVVKVGKLLLTKEEVQDQKSTLRDHGVDVNELAEEDCALQIVRFPFGEDKEESEEFATFKGGLDGKALQQFAVEIIPNMAQDVTNLEQFLAMPRPDGKQGFAPKVILVTNKDEAPGVFRALAANLAGTTTFVFGYVRASDPANIDIVKRLGVKKIPGMTIAGLMQGDGPSLEGAVKLGFQPYHGALKYSHMHMFLNLIAQMVGASTVEEAGPAASGPSVPEVASDTALKDLCEEKAGLCVLAMLDGKEDTSSYTKVLQTIAQKREGQPLQFGWVDARKQPTFAAALAVTGTAALPTIVAISMRKQRHAILMGMFDVDNVHRWLDSVLVGRVATVPLQGMPKLVESGEAESVAAADSSGKEVSEPVEEMDLSEILGEEIDGPMGTKAELLEKVEQQLEAEEAARLEGEKAAKKKKSKKKKTKKKKKASQPKDEL